MSDIGEVVEDDYTPEGPFPPESADDINGLLFLGHLEQQVSFAGHYFVIRTLKAGEEIEVALVTNEYKETAGFPKAWAIATVAAALESVDYAPLAQRLGPDLALPIRQKFNTVREYYWPVIEHLYDEYVLLLERQIKAFKALQGNS